MLAQLVVDNLGLIESAKLSFDDGLQVVTGETGVGKSLLLRSFDMLTGARAKVDWIRNEADEARVAGFFHLDDPSLLERVFDLTGVSTDADDGLLLERRLRRNGRHSARINGAEVPLTLFRQVGTLLVEVHGQHSQLSLLDRGEQLAMLDRFAGLLDDRAAFGSAWREAREVSARLESLRASTRERNDRVLYLSHIVDELEKTELQEGERVALERELALLDERDRLERLIAESVEELYEGEGSVIDRIARRARDLGVFSELHPGLREFEESCAAARATLEEGIGSLRALAAELEADPGRLEVCRERLDRIVRLEERYQRSGDELLTYLEEAREELDGLQEGDASGSRLESELETRRTDLSRRARRLTRERKKAANRLSTQVARELADLGMKKAVFDSELSPVADEGWAGWVEDGSDRLDLIFGPNPGEPARPLRKVASGGELSRVMLSLKRVLADSDAVATIVFDEIDAGVGGRLGMELGRKLREIGETHQVLCVTHLPQIASFGRRHFHVSKKVQRRRTVTVVTTLEGDERVLEIATMIRGEGHSETSVAEAREMMTEAGGSW